MRASGDDADFALHPQQPRGDRRGRANYLCGRKNLAPDAELVGLAAVHRPEQVGAEGHRDAGLAKNAERGEACTAHLLDLRDRVQLQAEPRPLLGERVVGDEGRHGHRLLFGHQPGRRCVHKITVLN